MKKSILTFSIAVLLVGFSATSCKSNTNEEQVAQDKVEEAQIDLDVAKQDLTAARKNATAEEWKAFKDDTNAKIDSNAAKIDELKANMRKTGRDVDNVYQKNVDALEQKNKELKIKMNNYKNDANSDWESFKKDLNDNLEQVQTSFKDFKEKNKK